MDADPTRAVILLSGGQDSTTCLAWALERFVEVRSLAFDYGQRHRIELEAAAAVAEAAGVPHSVLPIDTFRAIGGDALTGDAAISEQGPGGLPSTFVPGRNLVFLTYAAAFAWRHGISELVTGVCQTDYSGYPDCRRSTMQALQTALRAGMDAPFSIHTPLMDLSKADTVRLLRDLGRLDLLRHSHTCYAGERPPCGHCPACRLRAKGFAEAGVADPLLTAS